MLATQSAAAAMQAHDELSALLARSLTLNPAPVPAPEQPQIVYSISQHYHHSAHVVRPQEEQQQQQQRPQEPEPTAQATLQEQAAERQLIQSGIDPASLTPVQLALFQMAAPDRREYLVQLWRIYPPGTASGAAAYNPVAAAAAAAAWGGDSSCAAPEETMSLDGTAVAVAVAPQQTTAATTTTTQAADGRWLQAASQNYMEPYMLSGYEQLARREYLASAAATGADRDSDSLASIPRSSRSATDPVYGNRLDASSWPPAHQAATAMEFQYGALMAMRDGGDMEL